MLHSRFHRMSWGVGRRSDSTLENQRTMDHELEQIPLLPILEGTSTTSLSWNICTSWVRGFQRVSACYEATTSWLAVNRFPVNRVEQEKSPAAWTTWEFFCTLPTDLGSVPPQVPLSIPPDCLAEPLSNALFQMLTLDPLPSPADSHVLIEAL